MSDLRRIEHRVSIERLPRWFAALEQAIRETGVDGQQPDALLSAALGVKCGECGIAITSEEIGQIVQADASAVRNDPKLERLRLGYCARNGCASRFYVLQLEPAAGADWPKMLARADEILDLSPVASRVVTAPSGLGSQLRGFWRQLQPRQQHQLMVLAALGLLLLAIHWYRRGAWIPGLSPRPKVFIVEDASGNSEGGGTTGFPQIPSATNTPRTFMVR